MTLPLRTTVATLLLASLMCAQQLCVTISPNPAPLGTPITVTAQAVTPGLYTPFGCLISSVRSGMPGGPTAALFPCTFLPGAIPPCTGTAVRTATWNPNASIVAGSYWIEINHQPQMFGGPVTTEWHCVTIHDAVTNPVPALSAINAPLFGHAFEMSLSALTAPFAPYVVALSATTNTGIPIPGGHVCLDADLLFELSLMQDPIFFVNFSGIIGASGVSPTIALLIPPVVGIPCIPLHAQGAVFLSGGAIALSNGLNFTVR